MAQVSEFEAPPQTNWRKIASILFFSGVFCWGVFASLSTLSKLDFAVDFLNWSVGQAPITLKSALLAVGRIISAAVSIYREHIRDLAHLLRLPLMPHFAYDLFGIIGLSAGRGYKVGMPQIEVLRDNLDARDQLKQILDRRRSSRRYGFGAAEKDNLRRHYEGKIEPFFVARRAVVISDFINKPLEWIVRSEDLSIAISDGIAAIICYGALVSVVVAVLFGIDYCYRHFG